MQNIKVFASNIKINYIDCINKSKLGNNS